ncbi:MAG: sigma-54-dependent Fis family transcriptional regulator [Candidatus Rifleibacteriota bacterium]
MPKENQFLDGSMDIVPCGSACSALDFLQQIYNSAPICMLAISRELKVIRMNKRLENFLQQSADDCLGKPLTEVLPSASELLGGIVNRVIISEKAIVDEEIDFYYHEDQNFWSVSAYPLREENGRIDSVSLIIHDVTELRIAQRKLERAYEDILELQEKLKAENQLLRNEILKTSDGVNIVGSSHEIRMVLQQAAQVAPTDATVLITGETGTGKELIARQIHRLSKRKSQPLVTINCAALPPNLIESELFGHEKGAFTGAINRKIGRFELASGGTIFLDEIGELPLELQSKLLRVLQENTLERVGGTVSIKIDVRVIAATNRDLQSEVKKGKFREDLFYRLNVIPIYLPPLRERQNDVIEIAEAYIELFSESMGIKKPILDDVTKRQLLSYDWPGNIRELRNTIERSIILCNSDTFSLRLNSFPAGNHLGSIPKSSPASLSLAEVEKSHILNILQRCNWKVRGSDGAANILGLKPTTLESRMAKLGIKRPR